MYTEHKEEKQYSFLEYEANDQEKVQELSSPVQWYLYVDGASRSNPGRAGAGVFLIREKIPMIKKGFFLGHKTNNQAEYLALLLGFFIAKQMMQESDQLHIFSDSLLLVKQLNGEYKVVHPEIKKLFVIASQQFSLMRAVLKHIPREKNREADEAANWGIDREVALPEGFSNIISV